MEINSKAVPVFQWQDCLHYFGDATEAKEVLSEFKTQVLAERPTLIKAVDQQDVWRARFLLEKLTCTAKYCGLPKLYQTLLKVEDQLTAYDSSPKLLQSLLENNIQESVSAIEAFLNNY